MAKLTPEALQALKLAHPIDAMIEARGVRMGRINSRGVRACACLCDQVRGKTPMWVNTLTNSWGCLKNGGCGSGDVFEYLRQFEGLDFRAAVERLGGADAVSDPETLKQIRLERELQRKQREARAASLRERDRAKAYDIFQRGGPIAGTPVADYLTGRSIAMETRAVHGLRHMVMPYYHEVDGKLDVIHTGPVMMAPIQGPDDKFMGVHLTWIDAAQPGRKATIAAPDGEPCPSKKIRGFCGGGAIRLTPCNIGETLIVGEGIETTLSVYDSLMLHGTRGPYAAWCGISLGNLSGAALGPSTPHPDRENAWVPSTEPDLSAPGMMPPAAVKSIILLGDGDSDPLMTRARLECAKNRFIAAGFPTVIRMAEPGGDFNDMLRDQ